MVRQLTGSFYTGSETQLTFFCLVQYIVVVIALTILDLLVVCIDVLTNWLWCTEIEWCALNLQNLTCRDRILINREIVVCVYLTDDIVNCWGRISNTLD